MAQTKEEKNASPKGNRDSGRTLGKLLKKTKGGSSEHRPLRQKNALKPGGRDRFPLGKFHPADPTGKLTWKELEEKNAS